jgi:hypothetical protein
MNLVSAIFDRMGVPPGPIRLQEQTLLRVVHCLKTGFGVSTFSHTSDAITRVYGVGQGSKAGPVSWAVASSLLFEAQDILGTGLTFQNPNRAIAHKRHSDGFVDDTTAYHSKLAVWLRDTPPITTVFNGLKKDAQTWERLLWTSGGDLPVPYKMRILHSMLAIRRGRSWISHVQRRPQTTRPEPHARQHGHPRTSYPTGS